MGVDSIHYISLLVRDYNKYAKFEFNDKSTILDKNDL